MPIKKSAVFLVALTFRSVGLLFFSTTKKVSSSLSYNNYCDNFTKTTLFSAWNILPHSLLFIKP